MKDVSKQCAFIRRNCPDEEAGLISYLQLYYCTLADAKPVAFTILVVWMSVLFSTIGIAASDFLCINLSTIAAVLGMSESLTGVTFLAFGNGSPDVFSTFAAMSSNSGSLAVGELMGAAGFITAVVAGSMAIVKPFQVARKSFVRDVGFFAVAASFSLVFLRDGSLRLWECTAMVGFYVFYVVFVVIWHWYLGRQRRIRLAETAARLHHHIPDQQELETPHIHFDEEAAPTSERSPLLRMESDASVPSLQTPSTPAWMLQDDDEDEARDRYLAELQTNMRVSRLRRDRRNTITPIRPSLIGAIEFRNVLHSLEKRSTNARPINLRQYSDDNLRTAPTGQSQPHLAVTSPENHRVSISTINGRNRSVSAGGTAGLQIDSDLLSPLNATPDTVIYSPGGRQSSTSNHRRIQSDMPRTDHLSPSYSSEAVMSASPLSIPSGAPSPRFTYTEQNGMLAPPSAATGTFHSPDYDEHDITHSPSPIVSPNMDVPILHLPEPGHRKSPLTNQFISPLGSPISSRPPSIRLPAPSMSPESAPAITLVGDEDEFSSDMRRYSWWPYAYLPAPQIILSTLFPTLYGWREKGIIGKVVGLATAPAVLLLTVTLPVVEPPEEQDEVEEDVHLTATSTPGAGRRRTLADIPELAHLAVDTPNKSSSNHPHGGTLSRSNTDSAKVPDVDEQSVDQPRGWNRWLAIVQLFTAPIFVVLIVYANLDESHTLKELLLLILGCLVFSLLGLLFILATTSPDREPKHRPIMCFLGFAVAIAWISTIANEVVGVLKALGVIIGMSDAILGLTIFAVGNSLGDLVADITVAKLGYPIMALSACFGGPMLNILLGIGIGGMYMTIHKGQTKHHKHPNKPVHYQPYELQVSTTLIISGITLLVTLCGLLIFVPLNGWRMDRKIGIGLIALWLLSTTGNVICEVLGLGTEGPTAS